MSEYLIIGGCIAAVGAIEGIRSVDGQGRITVIDGEGRGAYSRPLISYYLSDPARNSEVSYRSSDELDRQGVRVISGRAESIDRANQQVRLENGDLLFYDRLLIATGAAPIIPPIPGVDLEWVNTFYTMNDVEVLDHVIQPGMAAVVIGSGLIGIKAAEALCRREMQVTVVEREDNLLPALLDQANSELLQRHLNRSGITAICSAEVREINSAHKVVLSNGNEIPADEVIIAVGAKPAVTLAVSCGLEVKQGIVVDKNMRTLDEKIFAAGDVVETLNRQTGQAQLMALLPHAHWEGYVAGRNMAGITTGYTGGIPLNSVKILGLHISAAGTWLEGTTDTLVWEDAFSRLEIYFTGRKLSRYIAINLPEITGPLTHFIAKGLEVDLKEWKVLMEEKPTLGHIPGEYWEKVRGDEFDVVA